MNTPDNADAPARAGTERDRHSSKNDAGFITLHRENHAHIAREVKPRVDDWHALLLDSYGHVIDEYEHLRARIDELIAEREHMIELLRAFYEIDEIMLGASSGHRDPLTMTAALLGIETSEQKRDREARAAK